MPEFKDPVASILRNQVPIVGVMTWIRGALRDHYPQAYRDACAATRGFESWLVAPWDLVEPHFVRAEPDPVARRDWRLAMCMGEGLDHTLPHEMARSRIRDTIEALHAYADRVAVKGLAREARLLASALAHAFATIREDECDLAGTVERWRSRLADA